MIDARPKPLELVASIQEDGKYIWAVLSQGSVSVRERLPLHIKKMADDDQLRLLAKARVKLNRKLRAIT